MIGTCHLFPLLPPVAALGEPLQACVAILPPGTEGLDSIERSPTPGEREEAGSTVPGPFEVERKIKPAVVRHPL